MGLSLYSIGLWKWNRKLRRYGEREEGKTAVYGIVWKERKVE